MAGERVMGGRILVADGNPASAAKLCRYLVKQGSETVVCGNGEACLAEIGLGEVAMIFLEVMMPDISGLEVLSSIRQNYDPLELPVIITSEDRAEDLQARVIDLGANDFLRKPINCTVAIPRIYQQIVTFKLQRQRRQNRSRARRDALVATYNHDLQETLADAMAEVEFARHQQDSLTLLKVARALEQVRLVTERIAEAGAGEVDETGYLLGGKILRLSKDRTI